ncbi:DUF6879 family protein [Actinomadura oligospora]|uniref:DUF6879 family protein n=1 Tax=Actinomadura oligospora TaxID=111804 RepID=UPI000478D5B4|nr:DUF6879 family protein [Actinomadura oligospora]
MDSISMERRNELIDAAVRVLKLELRDDYGVDQALLAAWRGSGSAAVASFIDQWADDVRVDFARGQRTRRIRVVSEPLSEYQRFIFDIQDAAVDAGEDIRWLPRRFASTLLLPGNDMFVLDEATLMFNVLDGANQCAEIQFADDPGQVKSCLGAFEAAWARAIPHQDYRPV